MTDRYRALLLLRLFRCIIKKNVLFLNVLFLNESILIFQTILHVHHHYNKLLPTTSKCHKMLNVGELEFVKSAIFQGHIFAKWAISIAVIADSYPLLPDFVPARSMACSMFSVVSMPKITGMSVCNDTEAIPLATSLQT